MVKYAYARDENKNIVHIQDALPKKRYYCLTCGNEMYAKNQKEDPQREHHFVHYESHDHSGESPLHYNTKCLISDFLDKKREDDSGFKIKFLCPKQKSADEECILYNFIPYGLYPNDCFDFKKIIVPFYGETSYSVLDNIDEVTPEKRIDNLYIPDVALLQNNKLIRAVEVVYTHEDSDDKTRYYEENHIDVIKVYVNDDTDFDELKNSLYCELSCDLIKVVLNNSGCRIPFVTTDDMLVNNLHQRDFLKELTLQTSQIQKDIDDIVFF